MVKDVKDVTVIYRIHETILISVVRNDFIPYPKNQSLTKIVLDLKEALYFWTGNYKYQL